MEEMIDRVAAPLIAKIFLSGHIVVVYPRIQTVATLRFSVLLMLHADPLQWTHVRTSCSISLASTHRACPCSAKSNATRTAMIRGNVGRDSEGCSGRIRTSGVLVRNHQERLA
jgi:hypothetical protein